MTSDGFKQLYTALFIIFDYFIAGAIMKTTIAHHLSKSSFFVSENEPTVKR